MTSNALALPRACSPNRMDNRALTDAQLMERITRRDRAAFEVLYEQHSRAALGLALRILGERPVSEEIVQEAFWRVWKRASSFDARRGNFSTWLASIVHHLAIDELRRRHGRPAPVEWETVPSPLPEVSDPAPEVSERAWANLQGEQVRTALAQLPDGQRQVLELAYFEGLTHQEIAARLNEPLGTVHTRARLGLRKLKDLLSELNGA